MILSFNNLSNNRNIVLLSTNTLLSRMSGFSRQQYKEKLQQTSREWGRTKFRPTPYVRPAPETARPWQQMKNEIVEDEREQLSANRFNMDSQQAKDVLKQREKNHRRNVIEAQLKQEPKWEKFKDDETRKSAQSNKRNHFNGTKNDDTTTMNQKRPKWEKLKDNQASAKSNKREHSKDTDDDAAFKDQKKPKGQHFKSCKEQSSGRSQKGFKKEAGQHKKAAATKTGNNSAGKDGEKKGFYHIDPQNLSAFDRNYIRQKLTRSALHNNTTFDQMINDMSRTLIPGKIFKRKY